MIPVDQAFLTERDGFGDCWRACVASILELPRSDVPTWREVTDSSEQWAATRSWLQPRGWDLIYLHPWLPRPEDHPQRYVIVCGTSPREVAHAVVGDMAVPIVERRDDLASDHYGREITRNHIHIAHDPHPSRAGLRMQHMAVEIVRRS